MAYCPQCGQELKEDGQHECPAAMEANGTQVAATPGIGGGMAMDIRVIKQLLINPESSLRLNPKKDILYGVIGIAASIIGFFLWGLALQGRIRNALGFSVFLLGDLRQQITFAPRFLLIGLVLMIAMLGSVWGIGLWRGRKKAMVQEVLVHLGAPQLIFGLAFVVSAVLIYISFNLSLLVLFISLLTSFVLTVALGQDVFEVPREKRWEYLALTVTGFLLILFLLLDILG